MLSLLHDVVSPLCDVVSSLCDVVSPLRDVVSSLHDGVSPLRDVVLSLCDVVSPLRVWFHRYVILFRHNVISWHIVHVRMPYMHPGIYVHLVLCVR